MALIEYSNLEIILKLNNFCWNEYLNITCVFDNDIDEKIIDGKKVRNIS